MPYVRPPDLCLSVFCESASSYSHLIGGPLSRWVLGAPKSAALVPPRENLGGSYSMLNSIDSVCNSVRLFVELGHVGVLCESAMNGLLAAI